MYRVLACLLILLSVPILIEWLPNGGFAGIRNVLAFWIVGLTMLTWPWLSRSTAANTDNQSRVVVGEPSIALLGYGNNVAAIQVMAAGAMIVSGLRADIDVAWWASVIGVLLTPLLFRTTAKWMSLALGTVAAVYLCYLLAAWDFAYRVASDQYARELPAYIIPFGAILWMMMVIAAVPQVRLLQVGRVGIGRLRGDFEIRFFGSNVTVAVASAVVLCCTWQVLWLLWYAPGWLPAAFNQ